MANQPLIVVTNDDGIFSEGIRNLIDVAAHYGELLIVAPDKPQSGMGHAITVNNIIRMAKSRLYENFNAYSCTGTPVDCIKMARHLLNGRQPDLILSGINHGANTSVNVLYSGTMSAAVEGAIEGIPSVGFSLDNFDANADFSGSKKIVQKVIETVLTKRLPRGICLNVNIPDIAVHQLKGIKVCRGAKAYWRDELSEREDQHGGKYFWLAGDFENLDQGQDTDLKAIADGYASIVPVHADMTAYDAISQLQTWNF